MTTPLRVQRTRKKGGGIPDGAVYVGRPSKWGNPFVVGVDGTRARCVELFQLMCSGYLNLTSKAEVQLQELYLSALRHELAELRGKNLACWCPVGAPCHADVLLEIANR
jgi:hypothetical protein